MCFSYPISLFRNSSLCLAYMDAEQNGKNRGWGRDRRRKAKKGNKEIPVSVGFQPRSRPLKVVTKKVMVPFSGSWLNSLHIMSNIKVFVRQDGWLAGQWLASRLNKHNRSHKSKLYATPMNDKYCMFYLLTHH